MATTFYTSTFGSLHVNKQGGQKAPHKAVLLLAVIDLIEEGVITSPYIQLSDELVNRFHSLWSRYVGQHATFTADIGKPWYHMTSEPFWRLIARDKETELNPPSRPNYSVSSLRSLYDCAVIDFSLFTALQSANVRAELRCLLISQYCNQPTSTTTNFASLLAVAVALVAGVA